MARFNVPPISTNKPKNTEDKELKIIIVGSGDNAGLLAIKIAEMKLQNPNVEIVTLEEAKKRGLAETYKIEAPPPLPELYLKDTISSLGKSARNKRREAKRKSKKRKG